jgi:LytS/YehU family sensor histidine kinase
MGTALLAIVAVTYLYFKWQMSLLKKQNRLLSEKMELERNLNQSMLTSIKSQMNPHFFYNALNTIQSFIFSDDKRSATTYLSKFSKLTRMILEMSEKERITLAEEVVALKLYLEIEKARFSNDFEFSIVVDEQLDAELVRIPSMIVQPYVENAIKHGLLHSKQDKKLSILFEKTEQLQITIDDNGIGRKRSAELNQLRKDRHQPFSTEANQKRIELLNKGNKNPLGVHIIDKTDDQGRPVGTTVIIRIPIYIRNHN